MGAHRFDNLIHSFTSKPSRRGLLAALGGGLLGTFPIALDIDIAFTKNNHKHNVAGTSCRKLKQTCVRESKKKKLAKRRCCDRVNTLHCDTVGFSRSPRCCYDFQQLCSGRTGECCCDLRCGSVTALSGLRCCAGPGGSCTTGNDCCDGLACTGGVCGNPPLPPPCVAAEQTCPAGCTQAAPCPGCCSRSCNANLTCDVAI